MELLSTSNMLDVAAEIVNELKQYGIFASLYSFHTVKPLDYDMIFSILKTKMPIFTLEEHNIMGGFGSAVAELIAESGSSLIFKRFGIPDKFSHTVGSQQCIRDKYGLSVNSIVEKILELLR